MSAIDITSWELHNVVVDGDALRTRKAFARTLSTRATEVIVGGFSLRSPSTTEVWHYLFRQVRATGVVTLFVLTEELAQLFTVDMGVCAAEPVITHAMVNNQVMINSPAFAAPLYGLPGGGLITATKVASRNPDTTALDIPAGHICSFGDRMPIAQGSTVFFNDQGVDPRTYVATNTLPLAGGIYDLFQSVDGALWMFTSAGVYTLPNDALGQGQNVVGFLSRVPGLLTSKPRNAVATAMGVCVLDSDSVVVLNGGTRTVIPIGTYRGRRFESKAVDVDDLRQFGELHATPDGVLIGFRESRPFYVDVNLRAGTVTYVTDGDPLSLVGTLTDRDGATIVLAQVESGGALLVQSVTGTPEYQGYENVVGVICGRVQSGPFDDPIVRRVSVSAANCGAQVSSTCSGNVDAGTTSKNGEVVIGADAWSNSGGPVMVGHTTRSTRMTLNKRTTEANVEVAIFGGDRRVIAEIDVQMGGTWRAKKEAQQ